jgi:hypothetical protein
VHCSRKRSLAYSRWYNATAIFYGIARINLQDGTGKGIAIAVLHTNSTGKLATLNGMIMASQEKILPEGVAWSRCGSGGAVYTINEKSFTTDQRIPNGCSNNKHYNNNLILDLTNGHTIALLKNGLSLYPLFSFFTTSL